MKDKGKRSITMKKTIKRRMMINNTGQMINVITKIKENIKMMTGIMRSLVNMIVIIGHKSINFRNIPRLKNRGIIKIREITKKVRKMAMMDSKRKEMLTKNMRDTINKMKNTQGFQKKMRGSLQVITMKNGETLSYAMDKGSSIRKAYSTGKTNTIKEAKAEATKAGNIKKTNTTEEA